MIETLSAFADLTPADLILAGVAVFCAGVVRGFSGFALSALVIASLATVIPPIELIPLCWFLEMTASVLMVRGGFREANRRIATGLVVGSILATPIGLTVTATIPESASKSAALAIVLVLAVLQLLKVRARFLATTPGLYGSGLAAGFATGLASVGGLVVALYVLSQDVPARVMRATLVVFLFATSLVTFFYFVFYGLMTETVFARAVLSAPVAFAGVLAGQLLFRPRLELHYKTFCLLLLVGLACFGLSRMAGFL